MLQIARQEDALALLGSTASLRLLLTALLRRTAITAGVVVIVVVASIEDDTSLAQWRWLIIDILIVVSLRTGPFLRTLSRCGLFDLAIHLNVIVVTGAIFGSWLKCIVVAFEGLSVETVPLGKNEIKSLDGFK